MNGQFQQQKRKTFCGYLHVKRPYDQRKSLIPKLSTWRNRLVTVLLDEEKEDNERTNVVKILLGKKQAALEQKRSANQNKDNQILKKPKKPSRNCLTLKSNNCVIYRCKSRKEQHAFVLANHTRPLIYLAASNEVLCQHWMKTIRDCLWVPTAQQAALDSEKKVFPVSLVDNEYSFRFNLVGLYGYLCFNVPHKLVLRNSQDGSLIQDWTLNTISMRVIGEAAHESFALIERVSLNNEHVFVEMNSDFVPNHIDKDENVKRLSENLSTDSNLVLMNCSIDATSGPGLITFYCDNASQLVKEFKYQKRKDLSELRLKQQQNKIVDNEYIIEDLISDDHRKQSIYDDNFNDDLNDKLNEILTRKLSKPLVDLNEDLKENNSILKNENMELNNKNPFLSSSFNEQSNLENQMLKSTISVDLEKKANNQFDHNLPFHAFHASASELLDEDNHFDESAFSLKINNLNNNLENSSKSIHHKSNSNLDQQKTNQIKEFESSSSSSE